MRAEELMLGNYVTLYGAEKEYGVVDDICCVTDKEREFFKKGGLIIMDTHFVVVNRENSGGTIAMMSFVNPIKLERNILIQIGFTQTFTDSRRYLRWNDDCRISVVNNGEKGFQFITDYMMTGRTINYVHELQNLYYLLTNKKICLNNSHCN